MAMVMDLEFSWKVTRPVYRFDMTTVVDNTTMKQLRIKLSYEHSKLTTLTLAGHI